ncbi:ABC transporter permease [Natronolimnobius sp. AArcel1]|uniref:ABC transporter permease n=1 Tax=Natronolimnobius sp. AArcel1 TaxID=1679093 RepID=UPI0013EB6ECD|nr:ABC transporter permease [Natronolimnobius sp. AArcel1]NGM69756.1 ABC transporter permease [Natronolimnobius sp. AArcel1]
MSTERGRIQITGFDAERVRDRETLSDWSTGVEGGTDSRYARAWRRFRRNRSAMLGTGIVLVMIALAVLARPITVMGFPIQPLSLAPHDPQAILYLEPGGPERYASPSLSHPMGVDGDGRDIFSRVLYGGRYSISIGFVVVALTFSFGIFVGAIAGYYGGWIDEILMRVLDVVFAFPALVLALVLVAMFGGGYWQLVAAFALPGWAAYARLIRGEILSIKENEYVLAAKALGASDRRIIFKHIVPNAIPPAVVQATLSTGTIVIGVAALGFLGLGMPSGTAEWGTMLDGALSSMVQTPIPWWATIFPGGAIFIFVMAINMIGDGINDSFDAQAEDVQMHGGGG